MWMSAQSPMADASSCVLTRTVLLFATVTRASFCHKTAEVATVCHRHRHRRRHHHHYHHHRLNHLNHRLNHYFIRFDCIYIVSSFTLATGRFIAKFQLHCCAFIRLLLAMCDGYVSLEFRKAENSDFFTFF